MAFDTQGPLTGLSAAELSSLETLCKGGTCDAIPDAHATKLIRLGLVELVAGALEPLGQSRVYIRQLAA